MRLRLAFALALALAGSVAVAVAPRSASAEPSLWERARDPAKARAGYVARRVQRVLDGVTLAEGDLEAMQDFRLGALVVAEMSGAQALDDPELRLLLAEVMVEADVGREEEAERLVAQVIDGVGPGETWIEAAARVVLAAAARRSPERAIERITRALPLIWDLSQRSELLRERAEAKMTLGNLRGSAADARAALAAAEGAVQRSLARFSLGLVLERLGDLPAAFAELRLARATAPAISGSDLGVLDLPGVFSFRPFDAHYVAALTAMGAARATVEPEQTALEYDRALVDWERYLTAAPSDDPWVPAARLHRARSERERDALGRAEHAADPE